MRSSRSVPLVIRDSTVISLQSFIHQDSNGAVCQSHDAPSHPINYIPSEILSQIFTHCVSFPYDYLVPIALSQVCRKWRSIALETPDLWDTINVAIPGVGLGMEDVRLVQTFLRRSGARPLKVDFGLVNGVSPWTTPHGHLRLIEDVVEALVPHANRIRILENVLPYDLLHRFRLPRLDRLEELMVCEDGMSNHLEYPPGGSQLSDTLRVLDVVRSRFDVSRVQLPDTLSELYIRQPFGEGQISVPQSIALFSTLPHLTECTLDITRQSWESIANMINGIERIDMPDLELLCIGWSKDINVGAILELLVTPQLDSFSLRASIDAEFPWLELSNFAKRNRPPLSALSLVGNGIIEAHLTECLQECPSLGNFTLGQFTLGAVFLDALSFKPGKDEERLLPNLEYLDFEWCTFPDFPRLVTMLKSRGNDLVNSEERLKYFKMSTDTSTNGQSSELRTCGVRSVVEHRY